MLSDISLITPKWGKTLGGIESWAYHIAKNLEHYNCNVFIVNRSNKDKSLLHNIFSSWIVTFNSQVTILMTWRMAIFCIPRIIAGRKTVIFVHGDEILKVPLHYKIFGYLLFRCKFVKTLANSNATADVLKKSFGISVDSVCNPYIEFKENIPIKKIRNSKLFFLTLTRLVKRKNIPNIISALNILKKNGLDFHYHLAGTGPEAKHIISCIEKSELDDHFTYHGRVTDEQKGELYSKADLFLLPSVVDGLDGSIEGYGIVYIEANNYGVPVLSGNTGGAPEAVIDGVTGVTCDGSVPSIQKAISRVLDINFNTLEIVEHSRKHHYLNYDLKDRILSLYEK